jgi:hypothetical protein
LPPPCDITYTYSTANTDVNTVSNHWHGTVCIIEIYLSVVPTL